jgi:hypothetical protein
LLITLFIHDPRTKAMPITEIIKIGSFINLLS